MIKYQSLLCWMLLLLAVGSELCSGFEITSPNDLTQTYASPRLSRFSTNWVFDESPFSGRLIPSWITPSTVVTEDHVLLICPDVKQQSIETKIQNAVQNNSNLIAVIVCGDFSSVPGFGQYLTDGTAVSGVIAPVFETARSLVLPIIDRFNDDPALLVTINLQFNDINPWVTLYDTGVMIAMSIVDGGLAAAVIGYAIYQLTRFTKQDGLESSPEQLTCWIEIFVGAARVVYLVVDPLFSRNIFHNIAGNILLTVTVPFYAVTTVTLVYYWKELVFPKWHRNIMFLSKLRMWLIALVLPVAIAAEITAAVLRGVFLPQDYLSYISGGICMAVVIASGVLFVVHGIRVMRDLKTYTISTIDMKKQRLLTQSARFLLAVSALKLLLVIPFALMLTPIFTTPQGFVGIWFATFFVLSAVSLLHLLALGSPLPIRPTLSSANSTEKLPPPGTLETTATSPRVVRVLDPLGGPTTGVEVLVHEWSETEAQSDKDGRDSLRSSRNIATMSPGDRNSIANLTPYRTGGETTDDEDYSRKKTKPSVRQIVITDYSQKGSEESSEIDDSKMTSSHDSHPNRINNASQIRIPIDSDVSNNSYDSSSDSNFETSRSAEEIIVTKRVPQPKTSRRHYSDSEQSD
eukprot:TRINITY_DN2611_c0_g1_i1.p1 TRINITY_DN2611_c0_g1~~TRINITY_DN2611_c0_g1_i1.p1  ORF type:complete len:632 (+),score=159.93 TRINITY_DN2611_c0_g1_i1:81-1976(+)